MKENKRKDVKMVGQLVMVGSWLGFENLGVILMEINKNGSDLMENGKNRLKNKEKIKKKRDGMRNKEEKE